jgi:hypothetical protein
MNIVRAVVVTLVFLGGLPASQEAVAQVPPHQAGTICVTPQFWCWTQPPGPAGSPCACPTPYGWVQGQRG